MDEDAEAHSETLDILMENVEIVPYTTTDRKLNVLILIIVVVNMLILLTLLIPWGRMGL